MLTALLFSALVVLGGLPIARLLRVPTSLAPLTGLAGIVVVTTFTAWLRLPSAAGTALVTGAALAGALRSGLAATSLSTRTSARLAAALLIGSAAVPALILGLAFAGLEAPLSTHDGAFHVEMIDRLRHGLAIDTWYPMGFHTSVAAVLGLVPWLDTARGALEAAQGLAILAPLAIFALGRAFGLEAPVAATGAVILALTWTYPYDYHLWSGWPQGMGVLLVSGLLATAVRWLERPSGRLAVLGGVFAGAIVLSHGTEVYTSVLGLLVIALARLRRIAPRLLARHLALAIGVAFVIALPYAPTLVGWAHAGGATSAGQEIVDSTVAQATVELRGVDWLQYLLGAVGAGSLLDLPLRAALLALGLKMPRLRLVAALWATFLGVLLVVDLVDLPLVKQVFIVTYPWLADGRPRQVVVVFASLLAAGGIWQAVAYLRHMRAHVSIHPNAWRRLSVACALLLFFFGEGSAVATFKRLSQGVAEQNVYFADEAAAMAWLRQQAQPGDVLANDLAGDAGIWAPYKAGMPILLPRSAPGAVVDERKPILESVLDLDGHPDAAAEACALHVGYLFHGAAPVAFDERMFPDRAALEQAPDLEQVFASGDAAIFRVHLPCH
jgi:hypothetical protein